MNWEQALNHLLAIANNAVMIAQPGHQPHGMTRDDFVNIENAAGTIRTAFNNLAEERDRLSEELHHLQEMLDPKEKEAADGSK